MENKVRNLNCSSRFYILHFSILISVLYPGTSLFSSFFNLKYGCTLDKSPSSYIGTISHLGCKSDRNHFVWTNASHTYTARSKIYWLEILLHSAKHRQHRREVINEAGATVDWNYKKSCCPRASLHLLIYTPLLAPKLTVCTYTS